MYRLIALFLLCLSVSWDLQAQKAAKDPNNIYISEYRYKVDPQGGVYDNQALGFERKTAKKQRLKRSGSLLKFTQDNNNPNFLVDQKAVSLNAYLFEAVYSKKIKAYSDPQLKNAYADREFFQQINEVDTIISFDPETFEQIIKIVANQIDPKEFIGFEQFGYVYYNKKTNLFHTEVHSLGLIRGRFDKAGKVIGGETTIWIPVKNITSYKLDDAQITWAAHLSADVELSPASISGKGQRSDAMRNLLDNAPKLSTQKKVFNIDNEIMHKEQLTFTSIDTMITFHPETFEEIVKVVEYKLEAEDVQCLRLYQNWIWNEEKKQLQVYYHSFAPIVYRYDNSGKLLTSYPFIFIKL